MKNIFRTLIVLLVAIFTLSGTAYAYQNENSTQGDTSSRLEAGQTFNGLYARAATNVTVNGEVNGDVWVAGSTVEVNGIVRGNVYAAGSNVVVKGQVSGSVHAAGSSVLVDGQIGGSVYAAGSDVSLRESTRVGGAAALAGSRVSLAGEVTQQVYAAGNEINIWGQIGQYANLSGEDILLGDSASIKGDLKYQSSREARIANDRAIGGTVKHDEPEQPKSNPVRDKIVFAIIGLIFNLVIGFVLITWAPRVIRSTDTLLNHDLASTVLRGIAFTFLAPFALVLVAITLVGIPIAVIGLLFYFMVALIAPALASYTLGGYVLRTLAKTAKPSHLAALVAGSVIFTLISLLPFIGGIGEFILASAGAGAVVARGLKPLQVTTKS